MAGFITENNNNIKYEKYVVPEDEVRKIKDKSNNIGIVSRVLFLWSFPLLLEGLKRSMTIKDCGEVKTENASDFLGDILEQNWFKELAKAKKKGREPRLWRALFWTFIWGYMIDGCFLFLQMNLCKPFQPIMLALLVSHFSPGGPDREAACHYAGGLILISLAAVFIQHHASLRQMQRGMRMRVACSSLLYRKILRLSTASLNQTTAGQVINLLSNDVSRFDTVLLWLHYLWIMPFQVALMSYLIYTQVSVAAFVGVAGIILQTMPVQSYLSKLASQYRMKIAKRTDERVRLMNEIIGGIQVIKMYAWEKPFEKIVSLARDYELNSIMSASYLRGVYMSFMVFTERASLYITLLAFSLMGNPISAAAVFSLAQFYNLLQGTFAFHYPNAVTLGAECLVTVQRIQDFMMLQERDGEQGSGVNLAAWKKEGIGNLAFEVDTYKKKDENVIPEYQVVTTLPRAAITLDSVVASWNDEGQDTLRNVTLEIPRGKLCAVIGSVGSGKSSLLQLLLKELPMKSGKLNITGTISYASQEPFLFVASVRNNILFGLPYDPDRYKEVVKVCALEADFQQFPRGDQTLVGEKGVSLSGGQRARINLARAVYRQADIYLLDDPLSAVDTPVGRHLYQKCLEGYLSNTTRVLVTHQLHYLMAADVIVILKDGEIDNVGTYDELVASGRQFSQLLQSLQEDTEDDDDKKRHRKDSTRSADGSKENYAHHLAHLGDQQEQQMEAERGVEEEMGSGKVGGAIYWRYWTAARNNCLLVFMVIMMVFGQLTATLSDYWVTFWCNEQNKIDIENANLPIEGAVYASNFVSNYTPWSGSSTTKVNLTAAEREFDMWDPIGPLNTVQYLSVYTVLILSCVIFVTARAIVFFKCCMKSSKGLHDQMFHSILRGTMRFFDTNPSGRILNRFSKDIGAVDELLPRAMMDVFQVWLVFLSIIALVSATNPWLLMPIAFILLVFYLALQLYLNTAQDVKRLESVYKSPVFSHLTASLNGIVTIRASNSQRRLIIEFDQLQDVHSVAWYQYLACSCTLGFWLDIICVLFLACVCFSFVFFNDGNVSSGNVGLAVSQTMILMGMLQFGVRQVAEVVAQMTSVERVIHYTKLPEEPGLDHGAIETPAKWPSNGAITFSGAKLFYSPDDPPVLKDLTFSVEGGWKVGIVGRTGAGKSSLIAALFRLAPLEGEIAIDGINTGDVTLQEMRSKISIIPQEPVLFSASIRYNLDPLNKYSDADLWSALEAVELKEVIASLEQVVSEGGGNFSLGQRQLLCLARAILRDNQILVLDEATANVDPQTDSFIQKTIRERFSHCTVLTIAHRLNTVMDSDRVLVMDAGKVAEYDHPHRLLRRRAGHLYNMVRETGNMANALVAVARQAYEKNEMAAKPVEDSDRLSGPQSDSSVRGPSEASESSRTTVAQEDAVVNVEETNESEVSHDIDKYKNDEG